MAAGTHSGQSPRSLAEWQKRLETLFFTPQRTPAFMLFLDRAEAGRLWPLEPDPGGALAAVVAAGIDWKSYSDAFSPFAGDWERWRARGRSDPPPNLPLLLVTVMAAAEMHRDQQASASAYFLRLAEVLRPLSSGTQLISMKSQLSASFDRVAEWWCELSEWVSEHPDLGLNTIQDHPTLVRIGYPLSQALIRRADRMRLTHFFAALRLPVMNVPTPAALLNHLSLWVNTPRGLSPTFVRALEDDQTQGLLVAHVHRLATQWDGVVLTAEGAKRLDVRIAIDLDDMVATWAFPRLTGLPNVELEINGRTVELSTPPSGSFYNVTGTVPRVSATPPQDAIRASGEGITGTFSFGPVIPLRANADAGWLSADTVHPFEPHLLVVAPGFAQAVEEILGAAARPGWRVLRQRAAKPVIEGRSIYCNVRIEDESAFVRAVEGIDRTLVRSLRPRMTARPQLVNGLSVATAMGRRHYLRGGEPDLLLPLGDEPRLVAATLDGVAQDHPFSATGFPIPLRRSGAMPPGRHELHVDGETLIFYVHDEESVPQPAGQQLGWELAGNRHVLRPQADAHQALSGASVPGESGRSPFLLRRHRRQAFEGDRHGRWRPAAPAPDNPLFTTAGLPRPVVWELLPGPDSAWILEVPTSAGNMAVSRVRFFPPDFRQLDNVSRRVWQRISHELHGVDPLLDQYIRAWEGYRRHGG